MALDEKERDSFNSLLRSYWYVLELVTRLYLLTEEGEVLFFVSDTGLQVLYLEPWHLCYLSLCGVLTTCLTATWRKARF
jgi:hypothetical protein